MFYDGFSHLLLNECTICRYECSRQTSMSAVCTLHTVVSVDVHLMQLLNTLRPKRSWLWNRYLLRIRLSGHPRPRTSWTALDTVWTHSEKNRVVDTKQEYVGNEIKMCGFWFKYYRKSNYLPSFVRKIPLVKTYDRYVWIEFATFPLEPRFDRH